MSEFIFVLGSPNSDEGKLSDISLARIECAIAIHERKPRSSIIATGGFGEHFNTTAIPHRELVHRHLAGLGYSFSVEGAEDLLSSNTVEDARMIAAFTASRGCENYAVVTSEFHLARCRYIFDCLEPKRVELHGGNDPPNLDPAIIKHENKAFSQLVDQEGVMIDGVLHPHPARILTAPLDGYGAHSRVEFPLREQELTFTNVRKWVVGRTAALSP